MHLRFSRDPSEAFSWGSQHWVIFSGALQDIYLHCSPPNHISINVAIPPHPLLQTSRPSTSTSPALLLTPTKPLPLFNVSPLPAHLPRPLLPLSILTYPGFCNGMQEDFVPEVINFFNLVCSFQLMFSVSKNPNLILLHLKGSLDTLFCVWLARTSKLLFHQMMCMQAAVRLFLSNRVYPFLNSHPSISLHLTTTQTIWGSTFC